MASAFHGLPRKAFPSGWFWDMFSIGCKVPCALFPLFRPSTLALPSCVTLSGWLAEWGQKPTESGSSRLQAGRGNCLLWQSRQFLFLVIPLFLLSLSLFLSPYLPPSNFCFLPFACLIPSPRLSPSLVSSSTTLSGRYCYNPHLRDEQTEVEGGSQVSPKVTQLGNGLAES